MRREELIVSERVHNSVQLLFQEKEGFLGTLALFFFFFFFLFLTIYNLGEMGRMAMNMVCMSREKW